MNTPTGTFRKLANAERIAHAVLYEGYLLYPYRPSAVKNRQRWTFGGVYPQAYSLAQGDTEPWTMQTECLVVGSAYTTLEISVRFLHLQERTVGELDHPVSDLPQGELPAFRSVTTLRVGEKVMTAWQEAVEREVTIEHLKLDDLTAQLERRTFTFPTSRQIEAVHDSTGQVVGLILRDQERVDGLVEVTAEQAGDGVFKITVKILNLTALEEAADKTRDEALLRSFISTHAILSVDGGEFVSLLDPPELYRDIVAGCRNVGTWPVLVGEAGERNVMLSSPIILYDYPQIAPESTGDLFDSTEIDEILILRILTMTDDEKREARESDERARELLERAESLSPESLMKLHGIVRSLQPLEGER